MRSRKHTKANVDRRDSNRALITDTAPYEVPIIFSNDGFYRNISQSKFASGGLGQLIEKIVTNNGEKYTVPYRYKITKNLRAARQLSLIHPSAQFSISQFYKKYENLICYYCAVGDFSIRHPEKIGSSYFYKSGLAERNRYRGNTVDTTSLDKVVRNPASYFAYRYYDRLYKFFRSNDFLRLEKKFANMWFLDVSNCFGSIYTHTISWAVKDIYHAKDNVRASSFGNDFDKLMQRMNFNETNGICIGPEVSRIFAEVILQSIDADIVEAAKKYNLRNRIDFECRRYVDDYIVFAKTAEIAGHIYNIISDRLTTYNLHLNEMKLERLQRPFQTIKSQIVEDINSKIHAFSETILEEKEGDSRATLPKRLRKPDSAIKFFVRSIKACCFDRGVGYDMVANYVISSLTRMIEDIIDGYTEVKKADDFDSETYLISFMVLLELIYFLYTVHPTVASSFKIAKATILSCHFFRQNLPDRMAFLSERLSRWTVQMVRSTQQPRSQQILDSKSTIPIELLNIVLATRELGPGYLLDQKYLEDHLFDIGKADYFSIISCLFYIKGEDQYKDIMTGIKNRIENDILKNSNILKNAQDAHLLLDLLACPYLPLDFRVGMLRKIRTQCSLAIPPKKQMRETIQEMQSKPWFVQWESVDLLSMVRKKELSTVY